MITFESLQDWEVHDPSAAFSEWKGEPALRLESARPVLLSRPPEWAAYTLEAEVTTEGRVGFVGLVFGARDEANYEVVYVYPCDDQGNGEVQYDPCMKGSMTWQVYHDLAYRVSGFRMVPGEWIRLKLNVWPDRVEAYVGDAATPQLVITPLALGELTGRVGLWGFCPGYVRWMELRPLEAVPSVAAPAVAPPPGTVTEWSVSSSLAAESAWQPAQAEPNGVLNLNRLFAMNPGHSVTYARAAVISETEREATLRLGFSDRLTLRVNGEQVYTGEAHWNPPHTDGRIRLGTASVAVRLKPGTNEILAELEATEPPFGYGLTLQVES